MEKTKKHFLLAVSNDPSHQYGARFLGYFFHEKINIFLDLLNISPNPRKTMLDPGDPGPAEQTKMRGAYQEKGRQALKSAADKLESFGFPRDNLKTDLQLQTLSTVKDLVHYGQKGLYDSLVLGRRGLSMLEGLIQDSVSSRILDEEFHMPIWICREPEREKRNVLLCSDGSEPSLRASDHVGFILDSEPGHEITVLHVRNSAMPVAADVVMKKTMERLEENGIPLSRIHQTIMDSSNVSGTILDFARHHRFAAIAMGRKGCDRSVSGWGCWFMGSVSADLLKNLHGACLWIHK